MCGVIVLLPDTPRYPSPLVVNETGIAVVDNNDAGRIQRQLGRHGRKQIDTFLCG
jgi:hypothetical protein